MKKIFLLLVSVLATVSSFAGKPAEYDLTLANRLKMNIQVCADGIYRVRISPRAKFAENLMVRYGLQKTEWDKVECRKTDTNSGIRLETPGFVLGVDKKTGALSLSSKSGKTLVKSINFLTGSDPLCTSLGKSINEKYADLKVANNSGIIGDATNRKEGKDTVETGTYNKCSIINFSLAPGERFYGGGSTSRDHIQHRGEILRMWTTYQHTEIPQPFVVSSMGWGVFNNTTLKNFFDIGRFQKDVFSIYNTSDEADFYIMAGDGMPAVINAYTIITGRNYVQPKWAYGFAFGPHMGENQFDILRDAVEFRRSDVPCDLMWLEPQWMEKRYDFSTKKTWNFERFSPEPYWDKDKYPKREIGNLFIGRLHQMGFKLGLWLCEEYDPSLPEEDAIAKAAGKPQSGKEHWVDHLKNFIDQGVDGFKLDPARTIDEHPTRKYHNGYTDKAMHNLNQILLPKQVELMTRAATGKRKWHHYTAGYAGTQHWGASTSGDNGGGKTALFDQLNLGMSGHFNTSCDIMHVKKPLEMQGLHFGIFLPWVQNNSWYGLYHPFYFGSKEQKIYRDYVQLRYALLPYIYSAALESTINGMPLVRSMPLMFPEDRKVDDTCNQYMFGQNLLVGIFCDTLYLPKGEWTDFWTGEKLKGGRTVKHTIPANRAGLLFAREGAIIPMQLPMNYVGERSTDTLIVKVFPKGESNYTMIEDDGESYEYEKGAMTHTTFTCKAVGKGVCFTVNPVQGQYKGMHTNRTYLMEMYLSARPGQVIVNGNTVDNFEYGRDGILRFTLHQPDVRTEAKVEVRL